MPHATNALDGSRVFFEDDGGEEAPVVLHGGFGESVELVRGSPVAQGIPADEFRHIYVDHRGHGRSDKSRDPAAYAMPLRVADAVAVLDELAIERAHFVGLSWGGRLGFGIGEFAPDRVRSLVIGGQQPYRWPDSALTRVVTEALDAAQSEGMEAFARGLEDFWQIRFPEPRRTRALDNDPAALRAAWRAALSEGAVSGDLRAWRLRCLISSGRQMQTFSIKPGVRQARSQMPSSSRSTSSITTAPTPARRMSCSRPSCAYCTSGDGPQPQTQRTRGRRAARTRSLSRVGAGNGAGKHRARCCYRLRLSHISAVRLQGPFRGD